MLVSTKSLFGGMVGGAEGISSNSAIPSLDMTVQGSATSVHSLQHVNGGNLCIEFLKLSHRAYDFYP